MSRPLLLGLIVLAVPALAFAQAPRLPAFRPEVNFGIVFDDNVFLRPEPEGDIIMRLTPGFDLVHDSIPLTVRGLFRFDAERYEEREDLNDRVARANTGLDLTWRPNTRMSVIGRAGYQRTNTPQDLNATTGLTGGRQPASRVDAAAGFEQVIRTRRRLSVGGDYSHDDLNFGADSTLRAARFRYTEQLSSRSDLYFAFRFEQRHYRPGPLITSSLGTVGFTRRMTQSLRLTVEGGPRVTDGDWLPDINITASQTLSARSSFTVGYSHTQDVAVGLVGVITIDRVTGSFVSRLGRWETTASGGAFRNLQPGGDTLAYDVLGTLGRPVTGAVWLLLTAQRTFNDLRVSGTPVPGTEIVHNWAMVSVAYRPFRPR
jgi:hypothetical protein